MVEMLKFKENKINNEKLKKLMDDYDNYYSVSNDVTKTFLEDDNYEYLKENYKNINEVFNNMDDKDTICLNEFLDKIYDMFSDFREDEQKEDYANKQMIILYMYHLYRKRGFKVNELEKRDLSIIISFFMLYIDDNINVLDPILNVMFDKDMKDKLYSLSYDNKKIVQLLSTSFDNYNEDKSTSINYEVRKEVEECLKPNIKIHKALKLETAEDIYNYLYENVTILCVIILNSNNEEQIKKARYWLDELDSVIFKIENSINKEELINTLKNILLSNSALVKKIEFSFNIIDQCYVPKDKNKLLF